MTDFTNIGPGYVERGRAGVRLSVAATQVLNARYHERQAETYARDPWAGRAARRGLVTKHQNKAAEAWARAALNLLRALFA